MVELQLNLIQRPSTLPQKFLVLPLLALKLSLSFYLLII